MNKSERDGREPQAAKRDERELQAALEIHTPDWLPGAKLALSYKRLWDKRSERFVNQAARMAGIDFDELNATLTDDTGVSDTFIRAGSRATERGDPFYSDALARLVAAALLDTAKVHTINFVLDRLIKLEPVHVRIISVFRFDSVGEAATAGNSLARTYSAASPNNNVRRLTVEKGRNRRKVLSIDAYTEVLRTARSVVDACMPEIAQFGFLELISIPELPASQGKGWEVTDLGRTASLLIADITTELGSTGATFLA